jgi:protein SCO1/2
VVLLAALLVVTGCTRSTTLSGVVRADPLEVGAVRLADVTDPGLRGALTVDADGRVALVAPRGGLLLVYFGFLSCPDVCPTTLADVRSALGRLDTDDAARIEFAFVTVDPDRDGPEELDAYLRHFTPRFHALRESGVALDVALDAFLASARVEVAADGTVEVAHTGVLYAVDDRGIVVVEWPFGTSAESIAADLALLLGRVAGAGA